MSVLATEKDQIDDILKNSRFRLGPTLKILRLKSATYFGKFSFMIVI